MWLFKDIFFKLKVSYTEAEVKYFILVRGHQGSTCTSLTVIPNIILDDNWDYHVISGVLINQELTIISIIYKVGYSN